MSDTTTRLGARQAMPRWWSLTLIVFCFILAIYAAAPPPLFSPDAANYIFAGHSWSIGHLDTTTYKIGSRIYVVIFYFIPQLLFGVSIDTLSLTLFALALLTFLIILLWVRLVVATPFAFWIGLVAIVMAAFWIEWDRPLTENLFAPLAFASLLSFDLSRKAVSLASRIVYVSLCSVLCAIAFGVRPEALFLFLALWLASLFCDWGDLRFKALILSTMILVFAAFANLPSFTFQVFTGKPMPYQIKEYFIFYRSVAYFGDQSYGPASEELYELVEPQQLSKLEKHEILPAGLGQAIVSRGPQYASKLYGQAGLETLRADLPGVAMDTLASLGSYLFSPSIRFRLETDKSFSERWQDMEDWLAERDGRRERRATFEGAPPWRFSELLENRLAAAPALEIFGSVPPIRLGVPPVAVTILMAFTVLISLRRRDLGNSAAAASLYFLAAVALASFSQGFLVRYWANASLVSGVACLIYLSAGAGSLAERRVWNASPPIA